MRKISTLQDLIHAINNSLCIISSHSQYLQARLDPSAGGARELDIVRSEVDRAAKLLELVPRDMAGMSIHIKASIGPRKQGAGRTREEHPTGSDAEQPGSEAGDRSAVTVLVVDDETRCLDLLQKF